MCLNFEVENGSTSGQKAISWRRWYDKMDIWRAVKHIQENANRGSGDGDSDAG